MDGTELCEAIVFTVGIKDTESKPKPAPKRSSSGNVKMHRNCIIEGTRFDENGEMEAGKMYFESTFFGEPGFMVPANHDYYVPAS